MLYSFRPRPGVPAFHLRPTDGHFQIGGSTVRRERINTTYEAPESRPRTFLSQNPFRHSRRSPWPGLIWSLKARRLYTRPQNGILRLGVRYNTGDEFQHPTVSSREISTIIYGIIFYKSGDAQLVALGGRLFRQESGFLGHRLLSLALNMYGSTSSTIPVGQTRRLLDDSLTVSRNTNRTPGFDDFCAEGDIMFVVGTGT